MRRSPLAFLLLGMLGLLAAGGLVLGVVQSPTLTDLLVHNGAGETLQAGRVTGTYKASNTKGQTITFDYTAPGTASVVATKPNGKVAARQSYAGTQAAGVLGPVRALLTLHHFKSYDGGYRSTEPVSKVVTLSPQTKVTGTYEAIVHVEGGYVVQVDYRLNATDNGTPVHQSITYRLTRVDGWTRS